MPDNMKRFLPLIAILICGCTSTPSQWESDGSWYISDGKMPVDVFYICSTEVANENDENGGALYRALLTDDEKALFDMEFDWVKAAFTDSLNFYAPYYHQFTMDAINLDEEGFQSVRKDVTDEVLEAFDWYMDHINGGRPFIVAGFSQGGILTLDVLKHMSDEAYSRMVAAYVFGYRLTEEDLLDPHIKAADDADGWGETVSFNSVSSTDGIWDLTAADAATCINPLNWCTDSTPATFIYDNDELTVHVDPDTNVLIVDGADDVKYFFEPMKDFTSPGNLHHWDIIFYNDAIGRNALHRAYCVGQ